MKSLIETLAERIFENTSYPNVVELTLTSSGSEYTIEGKGRVFVSSANSTGVYVKSIDGVTLTQETYLGSYGSNNFLHFIDFNKSIVLKPNTNGHIAIVQLAD